MTAAQFCTFRLADLLLGVEVRQVQEVNRQRDATKVPLAPHAVCGLINLRGQIVTAIDLRRRFGLPDRPAGEPPMNVVLRTDDGPVCLMVDQIGDVLTADPVAHEPPPDSLRGVGRELIRGVYKLPGELLLALDTDKALTFNP